MSDVIRTSLRGPDLGRKLAANRAARRPWKLDAIPAPYTPRPVEAGPRMPRGAPASRTAGSEQREGTAGPGRPRGGALGRSVHGSVPAAAPEGSAGAASDHAFLHLILQKQRYRSRNDNDLDRANIAHLLASEALRAANAAHPNESRIDTAVAEIVRKLRRHPTLRRKAAAIAGCSTSWMVAVAPVASKSRPVPTNQCRDRLCPRCQRVRASRWAERVKPLLEDLEQRGRPAKFLTLTQQSRAGESLRAALRRFNSNFRAMYLHDEWRDRVTGFVAAREVTYTKRGHWHFHAHVLADFEYWPQADISKLWHELTGDSFIVDVRAVKRGTEREAIKYPIKFVGVPHSRVLELVESTRGVRMISIGGEWRKHLRVADMEPVDCPEGHELVPAAVLYERASLGCVRSTEAINAVLDWALERGAAAHRAVLRAMLRPRDALHDPPNHELLERYQTLGTVPS